MLQNEVTDRDAEVRQLLDKGNKLLEDAAHSPGGSSNVADLQDAIDVIRSEQRKLKDGLKDKSARLKQASAHAQKFNADLDVLQRWLTLQEGKIQTSESLSLDPDSVAQQIKDMQALQNELLKKSRDHETLNSEAQALIGCTDDGHDDVISELENVNARWQALSDAVSGRLQVLEDGQNQLQDVTDTLADVDAALTGAEQKLTSHAELGAGAKDPAKHADKLLTLRDQIQAIQPRLESAQELVDGLRHSTADSATDLSPVTGDLDKLMTRYADLSSSVNDWLDTMDSASEQVDGVQAELKNAGQRLADLEDELDSKSPPARDLDTLQAQQEDVAVTAINFLCPSVLYSLLVFHWLRVYAEALYNIRHTIVHNLLSFNCSALATSSPSKMTSSIRSTTTVKTCYAKDTFRIATRVWSRSGTSSASTLSSQTSVAREPRIYNKRKRGSTTSMTSCARRQRSWIT